MKRIFSALTALVIGVALLLVVILFAFYQLIQVGELRRLLIDEVEKLTKLKVQVGEAELRMGRIIGISFRNVALQEAESAPPILTAERALMRLALLPLLERKVVFYEIRLHRPTLHLARDPEGRTRLADVALKLLLLEQEETNFSLDLKEIKVEGGEIVFPDPLQAQASPAHLHFQEVDLALRRAPQKGDIAPLAEGMRLNGKMNFRALQVDSARRLDVGTGELRLEAVWTRKEIRFERLDVRSGSLGLSMKGAVSLDSDPRLEFHIATSFLPVLEARKYVPARFFESPGLWSLIRSAYQGEVRVVRAGVEGRLSEIQRFLEPGFEKHVWLEAELRRLAANPDRPYLPIRALSGRILLEKGVLHYRGFQGEYGLSRVAEAEGTQKGLISGKPLLELRLRGETDLYELRDQFRSGAFSAHLARATSFLNELSGRASFSLEWRTDFGSTSHYQGNLSLMNARMRIGDLLFSQMRGDISLTPEEIRAERLTASHAGASLLIRALISNFHSEESTFDLAIDSPRVRAGEVLRILFSLPSARGAGPVRGSVRYQGALYRSGERSLSGTLELLGVELPLFFRQPVREVSGKVSFDPKGIDFPGLRGHLGDHQFEFSGQWRYFAQPQLKFTFRSPEMDISSLFPRGELGPASWYDRLQARGRIALSRGRYEAFEFADLETDLVVDRRAWRLENFFARSLNGTVKGLGSFWDNPDGFRFQIEPEIEGVPVEGFLSWFDIGTAEITGKLHLVGSLNSMGKNGSERKRNLNGEFRLAIEDGIVRRFRLLVQILNLLDLSRWFSLKMPDINKQGIRFRSITGDFKISRGIYSTQNLLVDSDDLRVTGAGKVDVPNDDVDFVVAIRPFPSMDSAVSFIPLIGQGLAAIKNTLLVASFRVKGPIDNPAIIPAPLSTLSEFFYSALAIPKSLIGPPGEEKK